jgi:hypothetical protein
MGRAVSRQWASGFDRHGGRLCPGCCGHRVRSSFEEIEERWRGGRFRGAGGPRCPAAAQIGEARYLVG